MFQQQNITVLIGGSQSESHACALSTVTGIPLVHLYGRVIPFNQCNKTVDMSADYRYFAHATFDVLASFHWRKISLVFDGNQQFLRSPIDKSFLELKGHHCMENWIHTNLLGANMVQESAT